MYKVIISYDMQDGKEQDCQEYLVNKLAPRLARLGFRMSDVWYTIWGDSPQITSGGEIEDLDSVHTIFQSGEWSTMHDEMRNLTENLQVRLYRLRN